MEKNVLAERSAAIIVFTIMIWVFTIILAAMFFNFLIENLLFDSQTLAITITFPILLIGAIIYTKWSVDIPLVLVYFSDGLIYICPKKNITKAVRPEEIEYISQKNYSGRGIPYFFGNLTVHLAYESIKLRWVRDVDEARRLIEETKADA